MSDDTNRHLTEPKHWAEWFEKCAWLRCGAETQRALEEFAKIRYRQISRKNRGGGDVEQVLTSKVPGAFWKDLEGSKWFQTASPSRSDNYQKQQSERAATTYKTYRVEIASSCATPEDARNQLEATVTFWIKDRFRDSLRFSESEQSLDSPTQSKLNKHEQSLPIAAGYAWSATSPASLDHLDVERLATEVFEKLSLDQKIMVLVGSRGVSLDHPALSAFYGRGKSALYDKRKRVLSSLGDLLRHHDLTVDDSLTRPLMQRLIEKLESWANSPECPCPECFT